VAKSGVPASGRIKGYLSLLGAEQEASYVDETPTNP